MKGSRAIRLILLLAAACGGRLQGLPAIDMRDGAPADDASRDANTAEGATPEAGEDAGADTSAAPPCVTDLAVGDEHTCAVKTDGTLWCWGANNWGQLGDGTLVNRSAPTQIVALGSSVVQVAAARGQTCARKADGTLWCWGWNYYGGLGNGTWSDTRVPTQVTALGTSVASVSVGEFRTCATKTDGSAWCWGWNLRGGVGDGTTTERAAPVPVVGLQNGVATIDTGGGHSCAAMASGALWCWGWNDRGQLGDGTTVDRTVPVQVTLVGPVTRVSAGGHHTCSLLADASLWCWGHNPHGQLGDGTFDDRVQPVAILGAQGFTSVASGTYHTCAIDSDAGAWCWGWNAYGLLGSNASGQSSAVPLAVGAIAAAALAPGYYHQCARAVDGSLWCWGWNGRSQLGDGTTTDRSSPVRVQGLCP